MVTVRYFYMALFTGAQRLCIFGIVDPLICHLLPNVWKALNTISMSIFVDVPYWLPCSTEKFISCVACVIVVLSLWQRDCNCMDSGENDDTWWYRTPSFFLTMQGVRPLLLLWTSYTAGNGGFWNIHHTHPIWDHAITISSPKWKTAARDPVQHKSWTYPCFRERSTRWWCTTPSKHLEEGHK